MVGRAVYYWPAPSVVSCGGVGLGLVEGAVLVQSLEGLVPPRLSSALSPSEGGVIVGHGGWLWHCQATHSWAHRLLGFCF